MNGRADVRRVLAMSDSIDLQLRLRLAAWSEGWRSGHAAGYLDGRRDAHRELADWHAIADPAATGGPSHAELERRRWRLRGEQRTCETFGEPHPGDYPGAAE